MPGKFLLKDRQEVVQEFAVIVYTRKQLRMIEGQIRQIFFCFLHCLLLLMSSCLRESDAAACQLFAAPVWFTTRRAKASSRELIFRCALFAASRFTSN